MGTGAISHLSRAVGGRLPRARVGAQPLLRGVPGRSQPRRASAGEPGASSGHRCRMGTQGAAWSFYLRVGAGRTPAVSQVNHLHQPPCKEARAGAAPPAAAVEAKASESAVSLPRSRLPVPPLPSAARAQASLLAAEQVHKNDLIYYRRHVLKQLTKLQDVKRQASAFSFLNPYRLLAMIKIVFSFLKLELIFLSKAIM